LEGSLNRQRLVSSLRLMNNIALTMVSNANGARMTVETPWGEASATVIPLPFVASKT